MERNVWGNHEHECPVCGLPLRSAGDDSWIIEDRIAPIPPEFNNDDALIMLAMYEQWLGDVTLLCDPDDEMGQLIPSFTYENLSDQGVSHPQTHPSSLRLLQPFAKQSEISEYLAEHLGGPLFSFFVPGGTWSKVNIHNWDFETFDGRSYIPIHSVCLNMAKRVIENSSNRYVGSMRSLFLALRWRHAVSHTFGAASLAANYTLGPTSWYRPNDDFWEIGDDYYYCEEKHTKAQWPGPTQDEKFNILYTFLSDPIKIDNITDTLLSNLEPVRRGVVEDEAHNLRARLMALPEDIFQIILSHLRSFRDLPLKVNNILPQYIWKNEFMLAGKGLLPWLWDIDTQKIDHKTNEPCPGGQDFEWNWELLARKLTCSVDGGIRLDVPNNIDVFASSSRREGFKYHEDIWACTGYHNILGHVPRGLHNRRRIWQLLEEIFVGDQLPIAGMKWRQRGYVPAREKCVELPWTKEGNLRDSAIWLPSINWDSSYARRIGGEVYRIPEQSPLQYWQTKEYRARNGEEWEQPVEPASAIEILDVIRKLGYPV
ncbi:hypothetical protein F4813DRAFT_209910 [Daldinia decipiens]|uniref:uncharacterized protein n=1 Tax=Daldinia decipiens TaxID=326647 RepID=UPI0020C2A51A|nr:uncharacterized protein F4813DRAFT_209910 [Daldinia decipiens]KAI1654472.1 hypothetical protein F4813DRAFT_209910 [Daldinia decipiens]